MSRAGRAIDLGPTEYRLLEFLMERPGRVFSREQLLDGVWGRDIYIDERTVDVHVGRLRKALNRGHEADPIRTVRGAGYALDDRFGGRTAIHEQMAGVGPAIETVASMRVSRGTAACRGGGRCAGW